jgi:hypothetical protein
MVYYALQKIIYPDHQDLIKLPLDPRYWIHPSSAATCVQVVGLSLEEVPEELIRCAEACRWKFHKEEMKFYPS